MSFLTDARAQSPTAPTGLTAKSTWDSSGVAQYRLQWTDNSNNEDFFQIWASTVAGAPQTNLGNVAANSTSVEFSWGAHGANTLVYFWVYAGKSTIPIAQWGYSGSTVYLWPVQFNPPTSLSSSVPSTNVTRLSFIDNSTSEQYNEVSARDTGVTGSSFQVVVLRPWHEQPVDLYYYFQPGRTYEVRVRARNFAGSYTGYSNTITVTVPGTYNATPPVAPSNVSVAAFVDASNSNANTFGIYFDDNSADETGFEIQDKVLGDADTTYASLGVLIGATGTNLSYGTPISGYATGAAREFRIRSLRGYGPFAIPSAYTANTGATLASFAAPTDLRVLAPADDGKIQLFWSDNATTETGYDIEFRIGTSGTFSSLGTLNSVNYSRYQNSGGIGGFPPASTIQFQIRAAKSGSTTGYSNIATVTTPALTSPTNLGQTSPNPEQVVLTWTDNSQNEGNYEVQFLAPGGSTFSTYDYLAANTATVTINGVPPGTQFRVRATYGSGPDKFSGFSNTVTATPAIKAATSLTATAANDRQINLAWTDNSGTEDGYVIYCKRSSDSQFQICGFTAAGATSFSAKFIDQGSNTPFTANTAYNFEVNAFFSSTVSVAASASATTKDGVTADLSPPMFVNEPFTHTLTATTGQGAVSSSSITGSLPPGVTYNSNTRTLSGTPTSRGAFTPTLNISWANGWSTTYTLHLRPIYRPAAPIVATPIAAHTLTLGGAGSSLSIPLASTFADPDSESAVAIRIPASDGTPSGRTITIILNDSVTPLTVANFRAYLNNATDGYTNSIFHRLISGFVLQGGAYKSGASANAFTSVPKLTAIQNEPGLSNTYGTLAMAKQAGNPNSATTDFFFNLGDNTSNLDFQNEGFTVFGRVAQSSSSLLTTLNSLPMPPDSGNPNAPNYAVTLDGQSTVFTQLPHNAATAPASINSSQLLRINSVVSNVPVLSGYTVSGNTNPAAVSTSISGTNLTINGLAPGTATISLQVADLDGNQLTSPLSFAVTVNNSLSNWAAAAGLPSGQDGPNDDPDGDGRKNLLEYALMSSPGAANGSADPLLSTTTDGSDKKASITFKVRKFAALTYTVEGSSNFSTWSTVWTSANGFSAANVSAAVDNADHTLLTVKDSTPYTDSTPRFLKLTVTSP